MTRSKATARMLARDPWADTARPCTCGECAHLDLHFAGEGQQLQLPIAAPSTRAVPAGATSSTGDVA